MYAGRLGLEPRLTVLETAVLSFTPPTYKRNHFWFFAKPHRMLLTGTGGSINSKTAHISCASTPGGSRTHKTTALNRVPMPIRLLGHYSSFWKYLSSRSFIIVAASAVQQISRPPPTIMPAILFTISKANHIILSPFKIVPYLGFGPRLNRV